MNRKIVKNDMEKAFYEMGVADHAAREEASTMEKLLEMLSILYINNVITASRYTHLESLLLSKDGESKVLGARIIQSLHKKEIVL
jgi:hypothetical protein